MAEEIGNSELLRTWASDGTIVVPSNAKVDEGWLRGEQPPHEWMNYIHNVLGQKVNHVLSRGAADWDSGTEYLEGAIVNLNGDLWLSLADNNGSAPSDANSNWYRVTAHDKDLLVRGVTFGRGFNNVPSNFAAGVNALSNATTEGGHDTAVGFETLRENTDGRNNNAIGSRVLENNTTGSNNVGNGYLALNSNTTGETNTAAGVAALQNNTTGIQNSVNGNEALSANTTGSRSTAIGYRALNLATGNSNTALGHQSMRDATTGENNVAVGKDSGYLGSPFYITDQDNRIVMGNGNHTNAYIKVSWTVTSDARDKTELGPVPYGLDFVNDLQPTEFQFKAGGRDGVADGIKRYGFLAQDVLALEGDDPVLVDDEDADSLKLKESQLIPVLVQAIQELTARVAELEKSNE